MFVLQSGAGARTVWPREAIHDTVAAIVRHPAYRRDIGTTLLDRLLQWLGDAYERLVQAISGVPHGRLAATIAAGLVAGLIVARIVYAARLRGDVVVGPDRPHARVTGGADPWVDAERLAARGQFTEAAHALYRAGLTVLAARGLVRVHDSKTSGDYARELRRRGSPVYAAFRRFGARYDRIIYGTGVCSADDYRVLLEDARGLLPVAERAA